MREVGSRPYFFLLSGLSALSILILFWGLFYKIQPTASGFGLIAKKGKIERVIAPSGGLISNILVEAGSTVNKGQLLAEIDLEGYNINLRSAQAIAQSNKITAPKELEQKRISIQQQVNAIEGSLSVLQEQISQNESFWDRFILWGLKLGPFCGAAILATPWNSSFLRTVQQSSLNESFWDRYEHEK